MIPAIAPGASSFEVGRYSSTLAELHAEYVAAPGFVSSSTRAAIWGDFVSATTLLQSVVAVATVWVGGSFTTSKVDPSDIDCLYWVEADLAEAAKSTGRRASNVLGAFAKPNTLKSMGLRVDHYLMNWRSVPDPSLADSDDWKYYRDRGHWDDWWQRERQSPTGAPAARPDSVQRRGYLEVILDGFST